MRSSPFLCASPTWHFPTALAEACHKQWVITQKQPPHRESEAWAGSC